VEAGHYQVAIIGLGMMGRRMASNMAAHQGFNIYAGWDPDPATCAQARAEHPDMRIGETAQDIIDDPQTDLVYVACPPLWHEPHALVAIEAGKAIFCEKPLGIDVALSRALVDMTEERGLANAVNFPFAACPAVSFIKEQLDVEAAGNIICADVQLHFSQWPRPGQMDAAPWLARRQQGGFVREVISHFAFLLERLLGPASLESTVVHYPDGDGSEVRMVAVMDCRGIPVSVAGSVGGVGPDRVEFTLWGSDRSFMLHDWYWLKSSTGENWIQELADAADPRQATYVGSLDNLHALLQGKPNTTATFREALSVQVLIEAILAA
jgi:predicted dehydrogenase